MLAHLWFALALVVDLFVLYYAALFFLAGFRDRPGTTRRRDDDV